MWEIKQNLYIHTYRYIYYVLREKVEKNIIYKNKEIVEEVAFPNMKQEKSCGDTVQFIGISFLIIILSLNFQYTE